MTSSMDHAILSPRRLFEEYATKHQLGKCLPDEEGNAGFDLGDGLAVSGLIQSGGGIDLRVEIPLFAPVSNALARELLKRNLGAVLHEGILFAHAPDHEALILTICLRAQRLTLSALEAALTRLADAVRDLDRLVAGPDAVEPEDGAVFRKEFA